MTTGRTNIGRELEAALGTPASMTTSVSPSSPVRAMRYVAEFACQNPPDGLTTVPSYPRKPGVSHCKRPFESR